MYGIGFASLACLLVSAHPVAAEVTAEASGQAASGGNAADARPKGTRSDDTASDDTAAPHDSAPHDAERERRRVSLRERMNLDGSTGLLRAASASSGAAGTFRFGLLSSYFSKTAFLCPPCEPLTPDEDSSIEDNAHSLGAHVLLSATPLEYLEAYAGIHSQATSNDRDEPQLLQVLGDTNIGVKGFLPFDRDRMWSAGGAAELLFLNGPGGIGVDNTSFTLRALSTLDWSGREDTRRVPLRAHFNANYYFDNSGRLIEDTEARRTAPISRVERFGLGINRVDTLQLVIGAEGMFEVARPFAEWSIDIPSNRQDYVCDRSLRRAGDSCMGDAGGFGASPSRLTIGARSWLPWVPGLGATLALDIGTGHTSDFVEEFVPEPPYNLYFGVSYAADVRPSPPRIQTVEVERVVVAKPEQFILRGRVNDEKSGEGIANAIVHLRDTNGEPLGLPGAVTSAGGQFSIRVPRADEYVLSVSADGYRDGECRGQAVSMEPEATPRSNTSATSDATTSTDATGAGLGAVAANCQLKPMPQVSNIEGSALDAITLVPVQGVTIQITDRLNRQLELGADARGAFRFENIIPGEVRLRATAAGYLTSVSELMVSGTKEHAVELYMHPRPEKARIKLGPIAAFVGGPIEFAPGSSLLVNSSRGLLQELAESLVANPDLNIDVRVHAVEGATPADLASARAHVIRDFLILHGVDAQRLSARAVSDGAARTDWVEFVRVR